MATTDDTKITYGSISIVIINDRAYVLEIEGTLENIFVVNQEVVIGE